MANDHVDRRRGRRIALQASVRIKKSDAAFGEPFKEQVCQNVSLAGVYFETEQSPALNKNDVVVTSVSISPSQTRDFPFSRLAGKGRVVRVEEIKDPSGQSKRFGVALEFGEDMTALTATPTRGS